MRNSNKVNSIIEGLTNQQTVDFYRKGNKEVRYISGDTEHISEKVNLDSVSGKH